jgi:peptidoglycan hydrolase-like protein with peptidoglycan-binding domain
LRDFGFDPGPIDGLYTTQMQVAVRGYQSRYSLPVSGLLDDTTRLQLIRGLQYDEADRSRGVVSWWVSWVRKVP